MKIKWAIFYIKWFQCPVFFYLPRECGVRYNLQANVIQSFHIFYTSGHIFRSFTYLVHFAWPDLGQVRSPDNKINWNDAGQTVALARTSSLWVRVLKLCMWHKSMDYNRNISEIFIFSDLRQDIRPWPPIEKLWKYLTTQMSLAIMAKCAISFKIDTATYQLAQESSNLSTEPHEQADVGISVTIFGGLHANVHAQFKFITHTLYSL